MSVLHLESLPRRTTKSDLLKLLCEVGGIDRRRIGRIELHGATASVEIPEDWAARLVNALDGAEVGERRLRAWTQVTRAKGASREDHFQRLARLLEVESKAEAQQAFEKIQRLAPADAERTGNSLTDLVIADESPGLGGRLIVSLRKRNRTQALPWTRLGVGSPVLLSAQADPQGSGRRGVVCERSRDLIRVALNRPPADEEDIRAWRLDLAGDEVARQRQQAALERARTASGDRRAELRRVLLGETAPSFKPMASFDGLDPSLNPSQREAVALALSAADFALIHGPPGTGKTRTLVEVIRQAVGRGEKVLACAPSNLAVDNLLEPLLASGENAVRLGHPARVLPDLQEHTLDLLAESHDYVRQARKLIREARSTQRQAEKWTRAKPAPGAKREMRQEARELFADARRLEAQAVDAILSSADIVCATTTGLDSEILGQRRFDLAVIDEACQSTEPGCWIPILRCQRLVLAGDHCQLPPTVVSQEAEEQGFGLSLFERLVALHGSEVTKLLSVQYRMHEAIMDFSSLKFYDAALEAHPSVREHRLCDLGGVRACPLTEEPVLFIDTAGAGFDEQVEPDGESRLNVEEAKLVSRKVKALLAAGLAARDIAVIAPYAAQVRLLRELLDVEGLEIDSVDGFQGREKEAVIISLVRSNRKGEIGFLEDVRRMNVALTRARRKLIVIGDSATLAGHPFYSDLLDYFESLGAYHTVWEEED